MKNAFLWFLGVTLISASLQAESPKPANPGTHWVKITWYKPLPDSHEPDTSKLPDNITRPNQLIEYNKDGRMMSSMDFARGTDDVSGATTRYYWDGPRLKKQVLENNQYEAVFIHTYTYDSSGHEIKKEAQRGPGDKTGVSINETTVNTWADGKLVKTVVKNEKGVLKQEETYTYDVEGRKIREDYHPIFLYSARLFKYDAQGNVLHDAYLDKEEKLSSERTFAYDRAGRATKNSLASYYKGAQQSLEVTTLAYDAHGGCIERITTKDGKVVGNFAWKHTYDAQGSRVQSVHFKNGQAESVEVLAIRYY